MSQVCITNDIPDLRPCVVPGEHAEHCDGFAKRYDPDEGRRVPTMKECRGCLPDGEAMVGLVCWSCYQKLLDGLKVAVDVITHLRSVDRAGQTDNAGVRGSSGWVIPIPSTWRAADDLIVLLGHLSPGFPSDANVWEVEAIAERYVDAIDPDRMVRRVWPATDAVRFIQTMHSVLIQHPMDDYEHRVRNVRCPSCKQRSLLWKPPLKFEGGVEIECTNPLCGLVADQSTYNFLSVTEVVIVKEERRVARASAAAARRVTENAARAAAKLVTKLARAAAEQAADESKVTVDS